MAEIPSADTPYHELIRNLGLFETDLDRLKAGLSLHDLMSEHLQPMATKLRSGRRAAAEAQWKRFVADCEKAEREGRSKPTWYDGEDLSHPQDARTALADLASDISGACVAQFSKYPIELYEVAIKDELPDWMTWHMLRAWSAQITN